MAMNKRTITISESAKKRESIKGNRTRVSALSLRRRYGPHYQEVLAEHIEEDLAGEHLQFKVMKPLPTKADYDQMLRNTFTKPVRDWVLEASDIFDELKQEYEDWHSSIPDSLQSGSKADELQEVIEGFEQLEYLDWPEPEWAAWVKVFHLPTTDSGSRPKRLGEASTILRDCAGELERLVETGECKNLKSPNFDEKDPEFEKPGVAAEELTAAARCLEEIATEVDNLCLPGMF